MHNFLKTIVKAEPLFTSLPPYYRLIIGERHSSAKYWAFAKVRLPAANTELSIHLVIAMALQLRPARTEGASHFEPDALFEAWGKDRKSLPDNDDLKSSIISTFNLPHNDGYVYHATASVTLSQVQEAIDHGSEAGLHAWYLDDEGKPVRYPCRYRRCLNGLTI